LVLVGIFNTVTAFISLPFWFLKAIIFFLIIYAAFDPFFLVLCFSTLPVNSNQIPFCPHIVLLPHPFPKYAGHRSHHSIEHSTWHLNI
jgi:hypothetical protein